MPALVLRFESNESNQFVINAMRLVETPNWPLVQFHYMVQLHDTLGQTHATSKNPGSMILLHNKTQATGTHWLYGHAYI